MSTTVEADRKISVLSEVLNLFCLENTRIVVRGKRTMYGQGI